MSSRSKRARAAAPYRSYPIRRVLMECNRRMPNAHGPRAFLAIAALIYRSPQVGSGIVYIGDSCINAGRDHCCGTCRKAGKTRCAHEFCCMARLMKRCGMTAHRAKYDLADAGLVKLHNAGRRLCPCSRCNGGIRNPEKNAGGSIMAEGRIVGAATGYELDPTLFAPPKQPRSPAAAAASSSAAGAYRSPAERRALEYGQAKVRDALERLRDRAGP